MARTGRRRGNSDTREAILNAARQAFADRGFDGASIRAIATSAGVDPALVHHYFGSKDKLFIAATDIPIDPGEAIPAVLDQGPDGIGERLARLFLTVWDSPAGATAAALLRTSMQHDWSARLVRDFLTTQIMRRIMRHPPPDVDPAEVPLRASLVASQLLGVAVTRYVLKLEPIASTPRESLVALLAPTIQRYVTADLDVPPPAD